MLGSDCASCCLGGGDKPVCCIRGEPSTDAKCILLNAVKSFGTEDRAPPSGRFVPPAEDRFDFVIFKGLLPLSLRSLSSANATLSKLVRNRNRHHLAGCEAVLQRATQTGNPYQLLFGTLSKLLQKAFHMLSFDPLHFIKSDSPLQPFAPPPSAQDSQPATAYPQPQTSVWGPPALSAPQSKQSHFLQLDCMLSLSLRECRFSKPRCIMRKLDHLQVAHGDRNPRPPQCQPLSSLLPCSLPKPVLLLHQVWRCPACGVPSAVILDAKF